MDLLVQDCGAVDWCKAAEIVSYVLFKVSGIAFDAFVTALFTVGLGTIIGLLALLVRWLLYKKQEGLLLELAKLRTEGVGLRNDGLGANLRGRTFNAWNAEIGNWKKKLIDTARRFSPIEAERLDTLDWMEAIKFPSVTNKRQEHILQDTSETLKRLERLLEEKYRPKFQP